MAEAVNWGLAEKVAVRVAGSEPLATSYHYTSLAPDFDELTAEAEELVFVETGMRSLRGPARAEVVDRADWVRANINSMRRLLRPLTERLESGLNGPLALPAQTVAGVEVGTMLGWMATRVLGQYDALLFDEENAGDVVYYVGPNVLAIEKRFGFPPREFRLVAGAARGHPPRAVHRHRLDAGLLPFADRRHPRRRRYRSSPVARSADAFGRSGASRPQPARRRRPRRAARRSRAVRHPAEDAGPHEPARGPRRRHDGSRRARPTAERGAFLRHAARAPQRAVSPWWRGSSSSSRVSTRR